MSGVRRSRKPENNAQKEVGGGKRPRGQKQKYRAGQVKLGRWWGRRSRDTDDDTEMRKGRRHQRRCRKRTWPLEDARPY